MEGSNDWSCFVVWLRHARPPRPFRVLTKPQISTKRQERELSSFPPPRSVALMLGAAGQDQWALTLFYDAVFGVVSSRFLCASDMRSASDRMGLEVRPPASTVVGSSIELWTTRRKRSWLLPEPRWSLRAIWSFRRCSRIVELRGDRRRLRGVRERPRVPKSNLDARPP